MQESVEEEPGGVRFDGQAVGGFDLAENLVFADHLGVERGGDAKEVFGGLEAVVSVEERGFGGGRLSLQPLDVAQEVGDGVVGPAGDEIDLRSVAGVEDEGLLEGVFGVEAAEDAAHKVRPERHLAAHGDGRRVVVQADNREFRHGGCP